MNIDKIAFRVATETKISDFTEEVAKMFGDARFNVPESMEQWTQRSQEIDWSEAEDLLVSMADLVFHTGNTISLKQALEIGLNWGGPCYVITLGDTDYYFEEKSMRGLEQEIDLKATEKNAENPFAIE